MSGESRAVDVGNVGQLRAQLERYQDDAPILTQVVAEDGTVWSVFLSVGHGDDCGFKWAVNPVILQATHPELKTLRTGASSLPRETEETPGGVPRNQRTPNGTI